MSDVRAELFERARELFSERGFKATGVADITGAVGVAVGTFYRHYASKEQLFIEVFLDENARLKRQIMATLDPDGDPVDTVQQIVAANLAGMRSQPILRTWYDRDLFAKLEKEFYQAGGVERTLDDVINAATIEIFQGWRRAGKVRQDLDEGLILAVLRAVPYVDIHKDEIGVEYFPQVIEFLTAAVVNELVGRQG